MLIFHKLCGKLQFPTVKRELSPHCLMCKHIYFHEQTFNVLAIHNKLQTSKNLGQKLKNLRINSTLLSFIPFKTKFFFSKFTDVVSAVIFLEI